MTLGGAQAQPSSFRDPSGFVYRRDGVLYRQVNESYKAHYDQVIESGLHAALTGEGLLISHEEAHVSLAAAPGAYKVLVPEIVEFVSYPYEWCFSQLRDAALTTLRIQSIAIDHGMWLQDATAYNIQMHKGRAVHIDTLSFEPVREGYPWIGYRQFCQHFLAPLALMAYRDVRFGSLSRLHLDGLPLDLAAPLLPRKARWRPGINMHLVAHARSVRRHTDPGRTAERVRARTFSARALQGLIDSLSSTISKLTWEPASGWAAYYSDAQSYTPEAADHKHGIVSGMLGEVAPSTVWDLGANTGTFSRIAAKAGAFTVAFDADAACVESAWRTVRSEGPERMLPLICDLTNPSPAQGWAAQERMSLAERGPADLVLALALIHHLAIGNNVPLAGVASWLAGLCRWLIIEFVPKSDPMVQRLLAARDDVFDAYTQPAFEQAFEAAGFAVVRRESVADSERTLYLMRRTAP